MYRRPLTNFVFLGIGLITLWIISFSVDGNDLKPEVLTKYQRLKLVTNCNYIVTSGYRSRSHNKAVGGVPKSFHIKRMAMDLVPHRDCNKSLKEIGEHAVGLFNGVIVYSDHIHVDVGERKYNNLKDL